MRWIDAGRSLTDNGCDGRHERPGRARPGMISGKGYDMYELLLRTETLFLGLNSLVLLAIGIPALAVGLVFWLGGTRYSTIIIGLLVCLVAVFSVRAQESENFKLKEEVEDAGGHPANGQAPSSSAFKVKVGACGENTGGVRMSSTSFTMTSGFRGGPSNIN